MFFGRNDAEAETPVLWPPQAKSWHIGKDPYAGRDWGKQEKGTLEDEMAEWHHQLDGRESEWTPGDGDGQPSDFFAIENQDSVSWISDSQRGHNRNLDM